MWLKDRASIIYPVVPAEEWAARYDISLEPRPCKNCGTLMYPVAPFATGGWRGLKSEPHEPCGAGCTFARGRAIGEDGRNVKKLLALKNGG